MPPGKDVLLASSITHAIPTASHRNGWLANQCVLVYSLCDLSRLVKSSHLTINLNAMGKSTIQRDMPCHHVLTHDSLVLQLNPVIVVNPIAKAILVHRRPKKMKNSLDNSLSLKKILMRRIYHHHNHYMMWSKSSHLSKRCSILLVMHHWSTSSWIAWI